MRKFTLLGLVIMISGGLFAQQVSTKVLQTTFTKHGEVVKANKKAQTKASYDLIWSDDFSDPNNWTITTEAGDLMWGIGDPEVDATELVDYTGKDPFPFSVSEGNVAYFNPIKYLITGPMPDPLSALDGVLTYNGTIDISSVNNLVMLEFYQRYKAGNFDTHAVIEISADGTSWIAINTLDEYVVGQYAPDLMQFNLYNLLDASVTELHIRFRWTCPEPTSAQDAGYKYFYGWMLDDIAVKEAPANEVRMNYAQLEMQEFFTTDNPYGYYYNIPVRFVTGVGFTSAINNFGVSEATDVTLNINVTGAETHTVASTPKAVAAGANDTLIAGATVDATTYGEMFDWSPATAGAYEVAFDLTMTATDEAPENNVDTMGFNLNNTGIYQRDNNNYLGGSCRPGSWSSSSLDNDAVGVYYLVPDSATAQSIHVYVHEDCATQETHPGGDGAPVIVGSLYKMDDAGAWNQVLSTLPHEITTADTGRWVTLPFVADGISEKIGPQASGDNVGVYIAAIEVIHNGHTDSQDDQLGLVQFGETGEIKQSPLATWWKFGAEDWGAIGNYTATPMIRLDIIGESDANCTLAVTGELSGTDLDITVTGAEEVTYLWSNGATTEDLTGIDPTTPFYEVTVMDVNTGCQVIESFTNSVAKVSDFGVSIYPNPATNNITIENAEKAEFVEIYNILGEKVETLTNLGMRTQIDVSNYANGTYFVKMQIEGQVATHQFQVTK